MATIGSNNLQIRRVMQREPAQDGYSYFENFQYRTKDVTSSSLGLVSLSSNWSEWQSISRTDTIYVDENGVEINP